MPAQVWKLGFAALWHPELIVAGAIIAALYLWWVYRNRADYPTDRLRIASFLLGVLLLYAGVGTPLDALSDGFLFSAHMLEHEFISYFAPPFLLMGMPPWMWRRILGPRARRVVDALTRPVIALAIFNTAFSVYHLPLIFEAGLHSETIHFLQHAVLFVTGAIMWWPVISPLPEMPRLSYPGKLLYLFLDSVAMTPIFAFILFAPGPLYPTYLHSTQIFGLTPMQDQQLGAIVMNLGSMLSYGVGGIAVFFGWLSHERSQDRSSTLSVYRAGEDEPVVVRRPLATPPDGGSRRSAH